MTTKAGTSPQLHQVSSQSHKSKVLDIGTRVDIRRTDGRVHSAYVAGLNYDVMCANVEWYENGEIKGKEIEIVSILALNPHLEIKFEKSNVDVDNLQTSRKSPNITTLPPPAANSSIRTSRANPPTSPLKVPDAASSVEFIPNRTSNVVKKIEKLKKNREKRRQKYVEEKIEKNAGFGGIENPHQALARMISEYRRSLVIKPLSHQDVVENHLIAVCVRKRPLNKNEVSRNEVDVITIPSINQLVVHEPKNRIDLTKYMENQLFRFDYAFDETCSNELVYKYTAHPLVKSIFQGSFATCFAYGQTGSGKTHTMGGNFIGRNQDCNQGVYGMATKDVFDIAQTHEKYAHLQLAISASFFEIYSGKVFDLLANKAKLSVLEDGKQQVQIVGLTEKVVKTPDEVLKLIYRGNMARTLGQTAANTYSSRSHAIFQLILRSPSNKNLVHGKLSLIDLAGNERGADTASTDRQTRMEGAEINKSLLALKECIRALGRKKSHLPFRMSKLTQVLKDSFIGSNSRTCMIAMISPGVSSCEHSLNTLRYANRVKELIVGDLPVNQDGGSNNDGLNDSLIDQEMSEHMIRFHHVVSELQLAEDKMVDNHKELAAQLSTAAEKAKILINMTNIVDYNQEQYCTTWDNLLSNTIESLNKSKALVFEYRSKMMEEEKLSRKSRNK